jgi:hypothetical protein
MLVVGLATTAGAVTLLTIDAVRRGRSVDVAFDGRSLSLRGRF